MEPGYNPAKGSNKLPALNALLNQAHQSLQTVKAAETKYINATNARVETFDGIGKLTTRMINALASTEATEQMVEDAMMIKRRMTGKRSTKPSPERQPSADNTGAAKAIEDPPATKTRGGQDFENQAMLFGKLLDLIASEPTYKPNEGDLQIAALMQVSATLRDRNTAVTQAETALRMARMQRDATLYAKGIHKIAGSVKRYVKSVYGTQSEQFASIGGLTFRKQ